MPISERTAQRLVATSGSTTLTLDKGAGTAVLQRKLLLWKFAPSEAPLADITDVTVDAVVDRASGVEVCSTMLVLRTGTGWAFPASDKNDARANADAMREFLGMANKT